MESWIAKQDVALDVKVLPLQNFQRTTLVTESYKLGV
jgi:hypothetical protein